MRDTIHKEAAKLKRVLELVRRDLPPGEVGVVEAFVDSCLADGLSMGRTCRYVYCLRRIRGLLDMDFKDVSRRDVERVMLALNGMGYALSLESSRGLDFDSCFKDISKNDGFESRDSGALYGAAVEGPAGAVLGHLIGLFLGACAEEWD